MPEHMFNTYQVLDKRRPSGRSVERQKVSQLLLLLSHTVIHIQDVVALITRGRQRDRESRTDNTRGQPVNINSKYSKSSEILFYCFSNNEYWIDIQHPE